jgi:VWFA-related protein
MIQTAKTFVDSLGSGDRIAIAAFTGKFHLLSDFTGEKGILKDAIEKVDDIEGSTAFYDAMWKTFDLLDRVKDARKAIVVLTDGVDNSLLDNGDDPPEHQFDELLERAQEQDATIYPIYLNPEEARLLNQQGQLKEDLPKRADQRYRVRERERIQRRLQPHLTAHRRINQLAEDTAGTVFIAHGQNELDGVYQRIAAELRLTYTIAYAPRKTALDGTFRKITVEVKRVGAVARTRRGYLAK